MATIFSAPATKSWCLILKVCLPAVATSALLMCCRRNVQQCWWLDINTSPLLPSEIVAVHKGQNRWVSRWEDCSKFTSPAGLNAWWCIVVLLTFFFCHVTFAAETSRQWCSKWEWPGGAGWWGDYLLWIYLQKITAVQEQSRAYPNFIGGSDGPGWLWVGGGGGRGDRHGEWSRGEKRRR